MWVMWQVSQTQLSSEVCPAAQPRCWGKKRKQQVPDIAESEPSLALNIQQFLTHLLEDSYGQVSLKNRRQKIAQKILFNFIFFLYYYHDLCNRRSEWG